MVYVSYQGSYDQIQSTFMNIMQDIQTVFKVSEPFGIYYDNPSEMENPDESRAILGCMVNKIELGKIPMFLSKFPAYKSKIIPN